LGRPPEQSADSAARKAALYYAGFAFRETAPVDRYR
jgi:hypothetical protein